MITKRTARQVISSRLLVLQSKRLMLSSLERRMGSNSNLDSLRQRAERLRDEIERGQHAYRTAVLKFGSPDSHDYWMVAYSRLIEMGNQLSARLARTAGSLPPAQRYEVASDVEALELIVRSWSEAMRAAMSRAVA